jgi:branched-chain amino acid transport system ATP-binding protein
MSTLLEVRDLSVGYGRTEVVHRVSLSLAAGSIVTVIGANGAGKTTLLNAIMGVLPAKGSVLIEGRPAPDTIEGRIAAGIRLVPENRELFGALSVLDNLLLGGFLVSAAERATALDSVYAMFPRLKERAHQLAGTLSGGERQMLALGRALMSRPRVLLLDEPSLGLAPKIVQDILRTIATLKAACVAVLLVEQNARAALEIADDAHVMELGEFRLSGKATEVAADPAVVRAYLGLGAA